MRPCTGRTTYSRCVHVTYDEHLSPNVSHLATIFLPQSQLQHRERQVEVLESERSAMLHDASVKALEQHDASEIARLRGELEDLRRSLQLVNQDRASLHAELARVKKARSV